MNRPYSTTIEIVRGCNKRCDYCGIYSVPKEIVKMTQNILIECSIVMYHMGIKRIEICGRGEPTLHPKLINYIDIIRSINLQAQIHLTTNGLRLTNNLILKYFKAGGNIISIDCYNNTLEYYKNKFREFPIIELNTSNFSPWSYHKPNTKMICLIDDLKTTDKKERSNRRKNLSNLAGNVNFEEVRKYGIYPLKNPLLKKCVRPFREIFILYNGLVPICCWDFSEKLIMSNIWDIEKDWYNSKKIKKIRMLLYNKQRTFSPCNICDYNGGFRIGLLPNMNEMEVKNVEI